MAKLVEKDTTDPNEWQVLIGAFFFKFFFFKRQILNSNLKTLSHLAYYYFIKLQRYGITNLHQLQNIVMIRHDVAGLNSRCPH